MMDPPEDVGRLTKEGWDELADIQQKINEIARRKRSTAELGNLLARACEILATDKSLHLGTRMQLRLLGSVGRYREKALKRRRGP
jgi:uncharacterized alpha-E superfamily protein